LKRLRERSWEEKGLVMEAFYGLLGIRRQGFHKNLQAMLARQDLTVNIKSEVVKYRGKDAHAGSLSLFHNLDIKSRYGIGITKFSKLLSSMGLSLQPLRVRIITTQSCARSRQYTNLLNGLVVRGYGEVVVGDLTYVLRNQLRYYVFSLFDICSARMLGIWGSNRMRAEDAAPAMEQWLDLRGEQNVAQSIHHTDGGGQYFSDLYLNRLQPLKVRMSVAQDCLQNGYAEQRNGLLKHHLFTYGYSDLKSFRAKLKAIELFYNYRRKQKRLGWRTPVAYEQYLDGLSETQRPSLFLHRFGD